MIDTRFITAGAVALAVIGALTWHKVQLLKAYENGREFERNAAIERANELNANREKNREELRNMPPDRLVCELIGGVWRNNQCRN